MKSLDRFDFTAIPSLNKTLVLELARCEYIERRENVITVGNSVSPLQRLPISLSLHLIWPRHSLSSSTDGGRR